MTLAELKTEIDALKKRVLALEKRCPAPPPPAPESWMPKPDPAKWQLVKADDLSATTPAQVAALWGKIDAVDSTRLAYVLTGGPDGGPYRRITAHAGDQNLWDNNCRAELGLNDFRNGESPSPGGTFKLYGEGDHCLTTFAMRLPGGYRLDLPNWKTVMQMKQCEPEYDDGQGPVLEMQVRNGAWHPECSWNDLPFTAPAHNDIWTFVTWEVVYSQDPAKGFVRVSFTEQGRAPLTSPVMPCATLKTQVEPPASVSATDSRRTSYKPGEPIKSHLRIGDYHDPKLPDMPGVEFGAVSVYKAIA